MAKPNYSHEKRQRDLAKKRKQEEKLQRKVGKAGGNGGPPMVDADGNVVEIAEDGSIVIVAPADPTSESDSSEEEPATP